MLVHLRKNETFAQFGADFGIAQGHRLAVRGRGPDVLAAWASDLHEALVGLSEGDYVIVDGTLIPTDRNAADGPYYSQKHKQHGMNV